MVMTIEFPHKAPEGYRYEYEDFKRNVISIWIWNGTRFDYNGGTPVRSIWGFYNTKTRTYHAPVSSSDSSFLTSFGWSSAKKMTSISMPAASPRAGSRIWWVIGGVCIIGPKVDSGNRSSQVLMVVVFSIG